MQPFGIQALKNACQTRKDDPIVTDTIFKQCCSGFLAVPALAALQW